jgi:hypothetical protein
MKKLYVLLMFIALMAYVACQRRRTQEREMQERLAAEHQAREQQQVTQREAKLNAGEKAPEVTLTPDSSVSPENCYDLKSQAQKFQPRRVVPMTSPIKESSASTAASSERPTDKLSTDETENQKSERKEAVKSGEGLPGSPAPGQEPALVQTKVPPVILEPILKKAAELAKVSREQLVTVRAESVIWHDGSLGCPEPGMIYTQALVEGYWVIIDAVGQTYDFHVDLRGRFQLCPPGRGQPPSQAAAK